MKRRCRNRKPFQIGTSVLAQPVPGCSGESQTQHERGRLRRGQRRDYGPPSAAFEEVHVFTAVAQHRLPDVGRVTGPCEDTDISVNHRNGGDLTDDCGVDSVGLEFCQRIGHQEPQLR
jgi:hypothetical protein